MDKKEAQEALAAADVLASRMSRKSRGHVTSLFLIGVLVLVLTLVYGLMLETSTRSTTVVLLLIPLLVLVIYTARKPVVPRYHRTLYSIITPLGAGFYAITVVFGSTFFPGELWWWLPGAFLCAAPFFLVGLLNLRVGRDGRQGRGPSS